MNSRSSKEKAIDENKVDCVMKNGSFFIPREELSMSGGMKNIEGVKLFWETDPAVARRILPPPLELPDPEHPVVYAHVANIREPGFAPWYMEACLALFARYRETISLYFLNILLSGPGALMGMCHGRENFGLPKKLCERIVVERLDDCARAVVEAKGRRILDVEVGLGTYNEALVGQMLAAKPGPQEKSNCFVFQYDQALAPDGRLSCSNARLCSYRNVSDVHSVEPASIKSIVMEPSLDDPWAELPVAKPLAATYGVHSEGPAEVSELVQLDADKADRLLSYLFSGRFDRSMICKGHQRFGQF